MDPSGQAIRFLKYQNGSFLHVHNPTQMEPESLRRALVGGLKHGSMLVVSLEEINTVEIEQFFDDDHFPSCIWEKGKLFQDETWTRLLRPAAGDPTPETFMPKAEFKFIVVTQNPSPPPYTASNMCIVNVVDKSKKKQGYTGGADASSLAIAAAFGVKEKIRNSEELVEAAFDGDWKR